MLSAVSFRLWFVVLFLSVCLYVFLCMIFCFFLFFLVALPAYSLQHLFIHCSSLPIIASSACVSFSLSPFQKNNPKAQVLEMKAQLTKMNYAMETHQQSVKHLQLQLEESEKEKQKLVEGMKREELNIEAMEAAMRNNVEMFKEVGDSTETAHREREEIGDRR